MHTDTQEIFVLTHGKNIEYKISSDRWCWWNRRVKIEKGLFSQVKWRIWCKWFYMNATQLIGWQSSGWRKVKIISAKCSIVPIGKYDLLSKDILHKIISRKILQGEVRGLTNNISKSDVGRDLKKQLCMSLCPSGPPVAYLRCTWARLWEECKRSTAENLIVSADLNIRPGIP